MATHNQSNQIFHALTHPSQRLVVTAPRQTGMTFAFVQMAVEKALMGHSVLIVTDSRGWNKKDVRDRIKATYSGDKISVGCKMKVVDDEYVCGGKPLHSYDQVFIDLAAFRKESDLDMFIYTVNRSRLVLGSTGSNKPEWLQKVAKLTDLGFTSIFVNVERHPLFEKSKRVEHGDDVFDREFKVNTGAPNGKLKSTSQD